MKKLAILLIFSLIPAMSFAEEDKQCREKGFIDLWDTICPDDWVALPDNNETRGAFIAPRSRLQIPTDATETDQIEVAIMWVWEYDEKGMFGFDAKFGPENLLSKAVWENYYVECNKNRWRINDLHVFSDITATNRIYRETAKSYDDEWYPIVFEETPDIKMNPFVLSMCNVEN